MVIFFIGEAGGCLFFFNVVGVWIYLKITLNVVLFMVVGLLIFAHIPRPGMILMLLLHFIADICLSSLKFLIMWIYIPGNSLVIHRNVLNLCRVSANLQAKVEIYIV